MMNTSIIDRKRLGKELSYRELDEFFNGYLEGKVKDYQMSALLMAICINDMTDEEVFALTKIFIDSGDVLDFSDIPGITVDKHSTGGIGDKTTLIIAPIVASCGVPIIKMSGRGLGFTGGTIDKLESIPGFRVDLSDEEIIAQVHDIGLVITSQTADLAPMDKVIYELRDVTGTVSSIPLIASSIMSKKIAAGAEKILIDIKVGNGALIKTKKDAERLSKLMIKIGKIYHREVRTMISDMNTPLGYMIGNSLEVKEAIDVLQGKETNNNLVSLCIELATEMVSMGKEISKEDALQLVKNSISKGRAYEKFLTFVKRQGGDLTKLPTTSKTRVIRAKKNGTIEKINAFMVGELSIALGAGRSTKEDSIDYGAGVKLRKLVGEKVKVGDILATLYLGEGKKVPEMGNIFEIN